MSTVSGPTGSEGSAGGDAALESQVSMPRLLATLGTAGALAGLLIVFVYQATQPTIQAHKEAVLQQAVRDVLQEPDRYDTLYVTDDGLLPTPPADADPADFERIYVGYRDEQRVGFAIAAGEPGFQDIIRLIFGYDPGTGRLLGMKVLESKETPGLGDKIEKDLEFVGQFAGAETPLVSVKKGRGTGAASEIDAITGATISSRAVVRIIDNALERLDPLLDNAPSTERQVPLARAADASAADLSSTSLDGP